MRYEITAQERHLPIVCNREIDSWLERFMLTESDDGKVILFTPREAERGFRGEKLEAIFDAKTGLATAVRLSSRSRHIVIELTDVKLNTTPQNRERLLGGNPKGFRITKTIEPSE